MTAQPLDATFTVPIRKDGAFATYLELPGSDDLLGTRLAVKVADTLDDQPFTATLMPPGRRGDHRPPARTIQLIAGAVSSWSLAASGSR